MKIALFGATGKTGRIVLEKALRKGHGVRALVRSPSKLDFQDDKLEVIKGDLKDLESVAECIKGSDAVINAAGPVKGSPPDLMEQAAENVGSAMKEQGIKRLVWLTGAGVKDERDAAALSRTLVRGLMKLIAAKVLATSERAYEIISSSDLDYTVLRPPMLSEKPGGGSLEASYKPPRPSPVSREDVADFILNALEDDKWVKESPLIGYTK